MPRICDSILIYEVLQRRKVLFDDFDAGLREFKVAEALHAFPDLFEPLFIASPPRSPEEVWRLMHFDPHLQGDRARVTGYLRRFIFSLSGPGE